MIDPRFKVVALRDGTVEVSWPENGRMIVARLNEAGALVTPTLLSLPIRRNGDRYGADGLAVPVPRKVDPARPTYATVLSIIRGQWRAIWSEAERQRIEAVERVAASRYKAECELFVERVGILSAMASARVAMQLAEGRPLGVIQYEIREFLEVWAC
jgi:hypothetical protein